MTGLRHEASGATVHLHLRDAGDDESAARLRERLAGVLAGGPADVRVHVEEQADPGRDVLRTLHAAAEALRCRGGSLLLVGAGPRVRSRVRLHGLESLLDAVDAAAVEPYPTGTAGSASRVR